jgi:hypothetical protein
VVNCSISSAESEKIDFFKHPAADVLSVGLRMHYSAGNLSIKKSIKIVVKAAMNSNESRGVRNLQLMCNSNHQASPVKTLYPPTPCKEASE